MIKTLALRINADARGHISSGVNVGTHDSPRPRSIDGFNLGKFPELEAVYGKEPKTLVVVFPVNDVHSVFDCEYSVWGKGPKGPAKKRVCDGEECTHRIEETHCGQRFEAGEVSSCACVNLPEDHPEHCDFSLVMRAMILHPETREFVSPNVYTFRSKSRNSAESIYAELSKTQWLTHSMCGEAKLVGIPFELSCVMVSSKDRANQKFPIWNLRALMFDMPLLGAGDRRVLSEGVRPQLPSGDEVADTLTSNGNGHTAEPPAPRTALELQAIAKEAATEDSGIQADDETRRATIACLATLTKWGLPSDWTAKQKNARSEVRVHALLAFFFGLASRNEMSEKECRWLRDWIQVSKNSADVWVPADRAIAEAAAVYAYMHEHEKPTIDALMLHFEGQEEPKEEAKEPAKEPATEQPASESQKPVDDWNGDLGDGKDKYGNPLVKEDAAAKIEGLFGAQPQPVALDEKAL